MNTNGNEKDGDESKEDNGVDQYGDPASPHVAEVHHSAVATGQAAGTAARPAVNTTNSTTAINTGPQSAIPFSPFPLFQSLCVFKILKQTSI